VNLWTNDKVEQRRPAVRFAALPFVAAGYGSAEVETAM
jgi:hypothetical protein